MKIGRISEMRMSNNSENTSPKKKMKMRVYLFLSIFLLLLIGASLSFTLLSLFYDFRIENISSEYGALFTTVFLIALYIVNIFRIREERKKEEETTIESQKVIDHAQSDSSLLRIDFEKFKRESINAFKVHLKVSILFWIHYYKKEKARSLEETRKEIFKDLRKEYSQISWMEEVLEELTQEIARYKNPDFPKKPP
jgi:hypothetical protein